MAVQWGRIGLRGGLWITEHEWCYDGVETGALGDFFGGKVTERIHHGVLLNGTFRASPPLDATWHRG